jgi:nucleoside-diphosphate kinase
MDIERTLSIIKPDAVGKNVIGKIVDRLETGGLKVVASKMLRLSMREAQDFYAVHAEKVFFDELVEYMISGPVVVHVLEGVKAIEKNRKIMGATNPDEADLGTIRADFAESVQSNAVHGSDGVETAKAEIAFFFSDEEIFSNI